MAETAMMDVWYDVAYQERVEIEVEELLEDAEVAVDPDAPEEKAA
jgi:hypothetical protein